MMCLCVLEVYAGSWSFFPFKTEMRNNLATVVGGDATLLTFSYIQIEEIAIQDGLNDASDDGNQIVMAFSHVPVDLKENK
jgi:hypothetical protein